MHLKWKACEHGAMKSDWWMVTAKRQMQQSGSVDLGRIFFDVEAFGSEITFSCLRAFALWEMRLT